MQYVTSSIAKQMCREGGELLASGADLRSFASLSLSEKLSISEARARAMNECVAKIIAENRARRAAVSVREAA
jgi:hypothetical protein